MKDSKQQKSGKMKKEELQAKKALKAKKDRAILAKKKEKNKTFLLTKKVRNLPAAIEAAFSGEKFPNSERKIQNIVNIQRDHTNKSFLKEILLHFAELGIDFAEEVNRNAPNPLVALSNLAFYEEHSIRPVREWKPNSHNLNRQIAHFARHLYAKYYIPAFMDEAWYNDLRLHRDWFVHVGQGQNIRTGNSLPIQLTKKEAHLMMQAPKDFTIMQAFRYGQILNLGGNEPFVRQVLRTRIATDFASNEFWFSVFRWFLQNPMLDVAQYGPLVDFIYNQKFVPYRLDQQTGHMICAQPNLSMKNRDPETTLRQMTAWHRQTGKEKKGQFNQWQSSGIKGFYHKNEKDHIIRMIQEICTQKELIDEGRTMKHCVGSYAGSCVQGRTSIWKFEEMTTVGLEKRLTIEVVNKDKKILQARGKYNALPNASDKYWLQQWARSADLTISTYMI